MNTKLQYRREFARWAPRFLRPSRKSASSFSRLRQRHLAVLGTICLLFALLLCLNTPSPLRPGTPSILTPLVVVGFVALGRWGALNWNLYRQARALEAARVRREALRKSRRERTIQERAQRQLARTMRDKERERLAAARAAQKQAEQQRQQEEMARRAARGEAIEADVRQLLRLTDSQLTRHVSFLFARRGYSPRPLTEEADFDILLMSPDGVLAAVARCVPQGHTAGAADVEALEAWRRETGATQAYLIALAGFSLEAVAASQRRPITLVEGFLLAHWNSIE